MTDVASKGAVKPGADRINRLSRVLGARSVAVVGASNDPTKISGRPLAYMLERGFQGELYPVNPSRSEVQGLKAYPSISAIGRPVDLAIVGTAAVHVEAVIAEGAAAGVGAFVIFSSGFAEFDEEGRRLQARLASLAREWGVTILGPNCLGVANSHTGLIASFSTALEETPLRAGGFSLVSQSGALGAYWLDIVLRSGLGFARWITTGNECDVQAAEAIEYLVDDPDTKVIGLYLEQVRDSLSFRRALGRAASVGKPVIAIKSGRSSAGAAAAASHTGALAGDAVLYDACLAQYGALRVDSLSDMIDTARLFLFRSVPQGPRLAVMSVSGGAGVLIADGAEALGLQLPIFQGKTREALRAALPAFVHPANPVDLTGNVVQDRSSIAKALTAVAEDPGVDGIVLFVGMMHSIADAFVDALAGVRERLRVPLVVIWIGALDATVAALEAAGLPVFPDVPPALQAISAARRAQALQAEACQAALPMGLPGPLPSTRRVLPEWEGKQLLRAQAAVMVPAGLLLAADAPPSDDFALAAPWAAKLQAAGLMHKSDAGGVILKIGATAQLREAFRQLADIAERHGLQDHGVLVEEMVSFDHEILIGLRRDEHFGDVLTLARGGVEVELDPDAVTRLLPLDAGQIERMLLGLRSARLFSGFRGRAPARLPEISAAIAALCHWFTSQPALLELEINPLALSGAEAWALDALVTVSG